MNHMWEEFYTIKLNQPTVSNFGSNAMNPMQPNKTLMWFLLLNFFIRRCDIQILIWFRAPPTVSFWLANSFYNSSISLVKREKLSLAAPSIYKRNSGREKKFLHLNQNGWFSIERLIEGHAGGIVLWEPERWWIEKGKRDRPPATCLPASSSSFLAAASCPLSAAARRRFLLFSGGSLWPSTPDPSSSPP